MRYLQKILHTLFGSWKNGIIAISFGCASGLLLYLTVFQRLFVSRTYLLISLVAGIVSGIIAAWLLKKFLTLPWNGLSKGLRLGFLSVSLVITLLLLFNTTIQPMLILFPVEEIQIQIPGQLGENDESEGTRLLGVNTRYGYIHYTQMEIDANWQRDGSHIVFERDRDVNIRIQAQVGPWVEIRFRRTAFNQPMQVTFEGETTRFNLQDAQGDELVIRHDFNLPWVTLLPFIVSFVGVVWFGVSSLMILIGTRRTRSIQRKEQPAWAWLLYMLPMLLAWGFTLLVFWPGMLSNDAMNQWIQGVTGQYNDLQSAFHALLLTGLIRIWNTPALAVIAQMIAFACVVAWGLNQFEGYGVPPTVLWLVSLLFAVSPVYNLAVVTIWKDVAYAIAFLWMTVMFMLVALSHGKWIGVGRRWLTLGLAGFLVAIFRLNGVMVAIVPMLLLPILFRPQWKQLTAALMTTCVLFGLVKGPLYSLMNVSDRVAGQSNILLLHHIAAHVDAGTPMTNDERAYLNEFMPLEDWDYWCCYVAPISYNDDFDRESFLSSGPQNRELALNLFLRDPWVNISHSFCAGNLVWKFTDSECHVKSSHAFNRWGQPGTEDWINPNNVNVNEAPVLKDMVIPYVYWLRSLGFADDRPAWFLRPAFYLILAIFCLGTAFIRLRDWKVWLAGLPIYVHTLIIYLISFAPAYRYHYNILFAGLFYLVFLFIQPPSETAK